MKEILEIDMLTAMPQGGVQQRSGQISNISRRVYREITDPVVGKFLDESEAHSEKNSGVWDEWHLANLREMRRIYTLFCSNPVELYAVASKIAAEGRKVMEQAQHENNWDMLVPHLKGVLDLQRQILEKKREVLGVSDNYDVILDGCIRGFDTKAVNALVDQALPEISKLYGEVKDRKQVDAPAFGSFGKGNQMKFSQKLLHQLGFDFKRGQLFVTSRLPALGGTIDDTRLLVRCVDQGDLQMLLEDTLFHGACALYVQNLPRAWNNQPVCEDMGSGMLDASGILMETMIGRSREFFTFLSKFGQDTLGSTLDADALFAKANELHRQVQGEEKGELASLPYLVISYRIEQDLINGKLDVQDLPKRWADDCKEYVGEEPDNDFAVFEQNPGWINGRFGIAISRFIAHLIAGQIHQKILSEQSDLMAQVEQGQFEGFGSWMTQNVWSQGRVADVPELVKRATGEPLSSKGLLLHLKNRFGG